MNYTQLITDAQEHQKGKTCIKCKEHKLLSEFVKDKNRKDGLSYWCKSCSKEYQDNMCRFKRWFEGKRSSAKRDGVEFTIEPTDIPGVKIREVITIDCNGRKHTSWEATEYPKVCPVFGIDLDWGMNGMNGNCPSLDRNPNFGYVKGKVKMMSQLANSMKNNATPEQLKQFSRYFLFGDNK
jgi:hypothetical protein